MRFEDQSPAGDQPGTGAVPPPPPPPIPAEPGVRPRRRSPRSWSTPPGPAGSRFDRPLEGGDWSFTGRRGTPAAPTQQAPRPPGAPVLDAPPPASGTVDLGAVTALLGDLRAEMDQLRAQLAAAATNRDTTLVTGPELAASIEALGATLGNGMATLLTEHRNLLARDIDTAADRITEELTQRLRTSSASTVDAVEERMRQVLGKALSDLGEQLDVRLEGIQTDLTGLRAVLLEVPDQTAVLDRLDHVAEAVGSARTVATEIAALRRRLSLRGEARGEAGPELSDEQLDDLADRLAVRLAAGTTRRRHAEPSVELDDRDEDLRSARTDDAADLEHDAADDEDDEGDEDVRPARSLRRSRRR